MVQLITHDVFLCSQIWIHIWLSIRIEALNKNELLFSGIEALGALGRFLSFSVLISFQICDQAVGLGEFEGRSVKLSNR